MSDRSLCKAKRVDNGEWITGYVIINGGYTYILNGIVEVNDEYIAIEDWRFIDLNTLCMNTTLKDKNGNMIFIGDEVSILYDECSQSDESFVIQVPYTFEIALDKEMVTTLFREYVTVWDGVDEVKIKDYIEDYDARDMVNDGVCDCAVIGNKFD